ncbi:MAG: hypothetical protein N2D54_01650, partial [Chloroflexota bacterium]
MMENTKQSLITNNAIHPWLNDMHIYYYEDHHSPMGNKVISGILDKANQLGHTVQSAPDDHTDIALTVVPYGKVLSWRRALMFTGRMLLKLEHSPV